jgi:hypothetical protein
MEVASMLAAEPFSDEPNCVCPVIAEFLRTYNDQIDNARRQDLYEYASLVVNTRDNARGERRRANMCLEWRLAASTSRRQSLRRLLWMLPLSSAARDIEIAHRTARWAAESPSRHTAALKLVEAMAGRSPERLDLADAAAADIADVAPADGHAAGADAAGSAPRAAGSAPRAAGFAPPAPGSAPAPIAIA